MFSWAAFSIVFWFQPLATYTNDFLKDLQWPLVVKFKCLCFLGVCSGWHWIHTSFSIPFLSWSAWHSWYASCFHWFFSKLLVFPCHLGYSPGLLILHGACTDQISAAFPVHCISTHLLLWTPPYVHFLMLFITFYFTLIVIAGSSFPMTINSLIQADMVTDTALKSTCRLAHHRSSISLPTFKHGFLRRKGNSGVRQGWRGSTGPDEDDKFRTLWGFWILPKELY